MEFIVGMVRIDYELLYGDERKCSFIDRFFCVFIFIMVRFFVTYYWIMEKILIRDVRGRIIEGRERKEW